MFKAVEPQHSNSETLIHRKMPSKVPKSQQVSKPFTSPPKLEPPLDAGIIHVGSGGKISMRQSDASSPQQNHSLLSSDLTQEDASIITSEKHGRKFSRLVTAIKGKRNGRIRSKEIINSPKEEVHDEQDFHDFVTSKKVVSFTGIDMTCTISSSKKIIDLDHTSSWVSDEFSFGFKDKKQSSECFSIPECNEILEDEVEETDFVVRGKNPKRSPMVPSTNKLVNNFRSQLTVDPSFSPNKPPQYSPRENKRQIELDRKADQI